MLTWLHLQDDFKKKEHLDNPMLIAIYYQIYNSTDFKNCISNTCILVSIHNKNSSINCIRIYITISQPTSEIIISTQTTLPKSKTNQHTRTLK